VQRALSSGRLSPDAFAWFDPENVWISLSTHPLVVSMLNLGTTPEYQESFEPPDTAEVLGLFPGADAFVDDTDEDFSFESIFEHSAPPPDPDQLALIPLEDLERHTEFTQFLALSSAQEQRRDAIRNSGSNRSSQAIQVFVAGVRERQAVAERGLARWWRARSAVQQIAALLALSIGLGGATGLLSWRAAEPSVAVESSLNLENVGPAGAAPGTLTVNRSRIMAGNSGRPLLVPEADLENDLEIADAVAWQPSVDFSSEEQILRSTRKVDAVRNIISLYRVYSWRLMNGAGRDGDPWLEPYSESSRIDDVLKVVKSALILIDSAAARVQVDGERLVFDNPSEAERYLALRQRADSLLQAPVELDSFPEIRAPRRVVTRLVATLPPAIAPFRVP
jgi:hypothetical protein